MSLGKRIRNLRELKNLERIDMANLLGISYHALSKYETDERQPDYETLKRIAEFFETSTDYMLGKSNKKTIEPVDDEWNRKLMDVLKVLSEKDIEEWVRYGKYLGIKDKDK